MVDVDAGLWGSCEGRPVVTSLTASRSLLASRHHTSHPTHALVACAGTIDLVSVVGPLDNAFKGTCTFEQGEVSWPCRPVNAQHAMPEAASLLRSAAAWQGASRTCVPAWA